MSVQACKMMYFLTPYSTNPWDFLSHDITRSKSPTGHEKGWHSVGNCKKLLHDVAKAQTRKDIILQSSIKQYLSVCEREIYVSDISVQNYLLWIFELYLHYWSQSKKRLNRSWPDMVGPTNPPSLMQEISVWLWCIFSCFPSQAWPQIFISPMTFPERQLM